MGVFGLLFGCQRAPQKVAGEWEPVVLPGGAAVRTLAGDGAGEVWAAPVKTEGLLHSSDGGSTFTAVKSGHDSRRVLIVRGPHDVWSMGLLGRVSHYDGSRWADFELAGEQYSESASLVDVAGAVWAVASPGTLHRWNGAAFVSSQPPELKKALVPTGVAFASGADDVYLLFSGPHLLHFDGARWDEVTLPFPVNGMHGTAKDDIWVVGGAGQGRAAHFDGATWQETPLPDAAKVLWGVAAPRRGEAWAVGVGGEILHFQKGGWSRAPSGLAEDLYRVYAQADGKVLVSGKQLYRRKPAP